MDYLHGPRTPTLVTDVSNDTTKKKRDRQTDRKGTPSGSGPGPEVTAHRETHTNDSQDSEGGVSGSHGKPDGGGRKWDEDGKIDKDEVPWIEDAAECAHICKYMQAHSVS